MNFIVAVSKDYAIGKDNNLLFNLPSDLKYFKQMTTGKVVVMGQNTYLSLPKRPLPNRINIVLSNDYNFNDNSIIIVRSVEELFRELEKYNTDDVMICGGASVYNLMMDYCKTAYITMIDASVPADTFIHNLDKKNNWTLIKESETMHENGLNFTFREYHNASPKQYK